MLWLVASCACSRPPSACPARPQPGIDPRPRIPAAFEQCCTIPGSPRTSHLHAQVWHRTSRHDGLPLPSSRSDIQDALRARAGMPPPCTYSACVLPVRADIRPCAACAGASLCGVVCASHRVAACERSSHPVADGDCARHRMVSARPDRAQTRQWASWSRRPRLI